MKRIIVTGGCGFIGSNLVRLLLDRGHNVLNFDKLTYAGNRHSLAAFIGNPNHQLQIGDLCDGASLQDAVAEYRPDWIMHLAAESHVDRSIDGPGQFVHTNVIGTFNLLQAARNYWESINAESKRAFRLLHVSTDEVYGSLGSEGYFTENSKYDPHSPYSASKAASDHLARAWSDTYGLPVLVTNCSNNYGPYQFPEKLVPVVILRCIRGEPIPVYGNGENIRDWLFVDDHCEALLKVIELGRLGHTYNIGGNNEQRNIDLVRMICRLMDEVHPRDDGRSYCDQITFVADRPGHDLRYAIDASKIRSELGWQPQQNCESGFRKTVHWYLENQDWWKQILSGEYKFQRIGVAASQR
jgi:dTDP-glucose 4,6-dehydratase